MISEQIITDFAKQTEVPFNASSKLFDQLEFFFKEVASQNSFLFPKKELDEPWHFLILHTKYYHAYCLENFGKFIHHTPMKTPEGFADCSASCSAD